MSLRDLAAADARAFLGDTVGGFAQAVVITAPDGVVATVPGTTTHVHTAIDPATGAVVTGERATVTFALAELQAAGVPVPAGTSPSTQKPWSVEFVDTVGGRTRTWKVAEAHPDRTLGIVTCLLERYSLT